MPSAELLIAFFLATSIFAYMPGPSTLYAAAQTIARGQRAGWFAALGIHIGGYVHVFAAALGLAVLFQAIPLLYVALKFGGAAYLIWLGFKMFTSKASFEVTDLRIGAKSPRKAFWESVTVEVLNPKTAIFYLAFLPQFTDPNAGLAIVRRQGFWNQARPKLRESSAHLVGLIMRRVFCDASGALRAFFV